jgi:hypothetical protein
MMTASQIRQEIDEAYVALEALKRESPKPEARIVATIARIDTLQDVLGEDPDEEPDE